MTIRSLILGLQGTVLTHEEREFFARVQPWGYILFKRNIVDQAQVKALTDSLRELSGRANVPILIDQEGGRVQRMGPPHWPAYPTGALLGKLYERDAFEGQMLNRLNARLIAHDLAEVGINVDCVPVCDVPVAGSHDVIGDRAYSKNANTVSVLARAAAEGLMAGGVLPIIKHIPGHGRAGVDSHLELPVVTASRNTLIKSDFIPFQALSDMPLAMTAHVVYSALDKNAPATTSAKIVRSIIRKHMGFDGLLMCDDLSMKALKGTLQERTNATFAAGCDMALHCNGVMQEMREIAEATPVLAGKAKRRAQAALSRIVTRLEPLDVEKARHTLAQALSLVQAGEKIPDQKRYIMDDLMGNMSENVA
jgi:beta-N-acetylhexosaminidase